MKFLFVVLMFTVLSCYNVERNCEDFKTGTFQFNYTLNGVEKKGTFIRTEKYNIDFYENTIDTSSIRWINDCEFILKKMHPKRMADEDAIHMKILSTTKNSYTFEYKLAVKKPNQKLIVKKGEAIKVE